MISEQQDFIIRLFKEYLDIGIEDKQFKAYNGDLALYFTFRGRSMYLAYDDFKELWVLYHLNQRCNPHQSHKYHIQWTSKTLSALIGGYLVNLHDAKNMNKKKSRLDELLDSLK